MSSSGVAIHVLRLLRQDLLKKCKMIDQLFQKYLLITNIGISASLSFAGDALQQHYKYLINKKHTWDKDRAIKMTVGGIAVGTLCHFWYQFLDRRFPGRTLRIAFKKVAIDQIIFSPVYITVFFATTCAMERVTVEEFKQEMLHKWWRLYLAEWIIWPPAQIINFYFLPPRFRVLYDNVISLGYDVFTSYVKNEIPLVEEKEGAKNKKKR